MKRKINTAKDDLPKNFDLNDEFKVAFACMESGRENLFITGKAGTGKSTLLNYFKANTRKNIVVLAPTGVAAIRVGGQTIHSFFKFPPRLIQRDAIKRRGSGELMRKLDAVVIDEVSMVRADVMDGIDYALRLNRGSMNKPFGGAQMIFFGDLFQLAPVVESSVGEFLRGQYASPFFFSARVFDQAHLKRIELTKVYRQKDRRFIELLNRLRAREHTEDDLELLNGRIEEYLPNLDSATVILTSTNYVAEEINRSRLAELDDSEYFFDGDVTGDIEESAMPTNARLCLKKGAQVILLKNDPDKQWVNGTIGKIASLTGNVIKVDIDGEICEVPRAKWQKIQYTYNDIEDTIEEKVVGSFEQYPLKLAWAITIHKSQGQTFDKIIIDLGRGAFTHGQVYVALTRCTTLKGITLTRPVAHRDIIFDRRIHDFHNKFAELEF